MSFKKKDKDIEERILHVIGTVKTPKGVNALFIIQWFINGVPMSPSIEKRYLKQRSIYPAFFSKRLGLNETDLEILFGAKDQIKAVFQAIKDGIELPPQEYISLQSLYESVRPPENIPNTKVESLI